MLILHCVASVWYCIACYVSGRMLLNLMVIRSNCLRLGMLVQVVSQVLCITLLVKLDIRSLFIFMDIRTNCLRLGMLVQIVPRVLCIAC